ncbi:MerR family transcriptional regulator [Paeniglutamicibacter sulfureus]|uniref:DNA-binding transcriptional MerR regulator n=1 Tax=Paeniglutamicibacter sulfureus TaxID=43666 RepID=A0ABU2BKT9_9MICC|nr:MerR family transcriptional regulator [Paeniglutamicibacter sulfureus]MDO2934954.1 MerR family transcriptional regulator [Paeniglutamicibacter sulfureus]MDR7359258.1 DNA-binding transcriptional MerR regulator [Paeniglutamicibacter sulfureus]
MTDTPTPAADARTMHIGDLAEATGLSQRTIRHYDEVGLLPATTRSEGGFRIYTESDLQRMLVIRSMKPLGFTLEEMGELLDTVDALGLDKNNAAARARLSEFIGQAEQKRAKLALNLRRAEDFIQDLHSR